MVLLWGAMTFAAAPHLATLAHAGAFDELAGHTISSSRYDKTGTQSSPDALITHKPSQRIIHIFQKTQAAIRLRHFPVASSIGTTESTHASAFVYKQKNILLSDTLVKLLQSEDQLAFAISHEMAHIALGHTAKSGPREELDADAFAVAVLIEMGLNSCSSASMLETIKSREPLYRDALTHRQEHLMKTLLSHCPGSSTL